MHETIKDLELEKSSGLAKSFSTFFLKFMISIFEKIYLGSVNYKDMLLINVC